MGNRHTGNRPTGNRCAGAGSVWIGGSIGVSIGLLALVLIGAGQPVDAAARRECASVQRGEVVYSAGHHLAGQVIPTGYNEYGYNYQAHAFNGSYFNVYAGRDGLPPWTGNDGAYLAGNPEAASHWAWPLRQTDLQMKWNDAWLSNQDCDGDGALDRHRGHAGYQGSGAWLTNRTSGGQGAERWSDFSKIVAAPVDATVSDGTWHDASGQPIGPVIWRLFAIIQEVASGEGARLVSPAGPGLGRW